MVSKIGKYEFDRELLQIEKLGELRNEIYIKFEENMRLKRKNYIIDKFLEKNLPKSKCLTL